MPAPRSVYDEQKLCVQKLEWPVWGPLWGFDFRDKGLGKCDCDVARMDDSKDDRSDNGKRCNNDPISDVQD